jgi:hypothetical protein
MFNPLFAVFNVPLATWLSISAIFLSSLSEPSLTDVLNFIKLVKEQS